MKHWEDAVVLQPGEILVEFPIKTKGTLHETDVITAEVHDADGNVTSRIDATDHTAINGFKQTVWLRQVSVNGQVIVDRSW